MTPLGLPPLCADIVEKGFLRGRSKIFRAVDAIFV
jgi:hypothetical protein